MIDRSSITKYLERNGWVIIGNNAICPQKVNKILLPIEGKLDYQTKLSNIIIVLSTIESRSSQEIIHDIDPDYVNNKTCIQTIVRLTKYGSSDSLVIPREFLDKAGIMSGDKLKLFIDDNNVIKIRKI